MAESEEYKRLKSLAEKEFGNLSGLASKVGKLQQYFYTYKNKNIGMGILYELKDKLGINPEYIKFGREPMLLNKEKQDSYEYEESNTGNITNISEEEIEYLASIKIYTLTAQACESKSLVSFDDLPVSTSTLGVGMKLNNKNIRAVRISGFSMKDEGIDDGDLVLFDIAAEPHNGNMIIAILNGVVMIKMYKKDNGQIILQSAKDGIDPIIVNHIDDELKIIGVVKHSIKHWY
jgi:hypothetical protein